MSNLEVFVLCTHVSAWLIILLIIILLQNNKFFTFCMQKNINHYRVTDILATTGQAFCFYVFVSSLAMVIYSIA